TNYLTQQSWASGHPKEFQDSESGHPRNAAGGVYGHGTSTALHQTAMGTFAFLFQLSLAPAEDWKRKGHQLTGTAGGNPQLLRCFYLPAHLPDPGRAPLYKGRLLQ